MCTLRTLSLVAAVALLAACSDSAPVAPGEVEAVATVEVTPANAALQVGQTAPLTATPKDRNGTPLQGRIVAWTSLNEDVATVSATGVVTAVSTGVVKVEAASEGKKGQATITVAAAGVPVASIRITGALDTLEAHETRNLEATLRDADDNVLTNRAIAWTSSNPAVAAVHPATGVLTALDRGTVTITATSEGKTDQVSRVVVIRYRSISAGAMHACNIASGGLVWCWGLNGRQGRIGLPRLENDEFSAVPVRVPGEKRFTQLATYGMTTCGLTAQGAAYCWGTNDWGVLGTGATQPAQSVTPVAVTGGHVFKQIVAGAGHMCGLTNTGSAYCWGTNSSGELGNGLRASSATPVATAPALTFASLTAGGEYTCGITAAGQAHCWGYSGLGNLGDGKPISYGNTYSLTPAQVVGNHTFAQISAGQRHTCGVTATGQAYCWGSNGGRLGTGGTNDSSTPLAVAGGHVFRSVAAGFNHSCGITQQDAVYCWGANVNGQLGLVLANGSTSPVRAGGTLSAAEVAAANVATGSASYTCAISVDRLTTRCWGRNDVGQLGNGTTSTAVAVNAEPSIVQGQRPL